MLKPENRLKKIKDFELVNKYGRWTSGALLSIKVLKLTAVKKENLPKKIKTGTEKDLSSFQNQLKIAVAVGLKFHKSAVKRNRVKRQIREVIRLLIKNDKFQSGYYILIQPKKECLSENYTKINQELELLFKKAKILKT